MRVLFLVPNPIEAASTRYRVVQFFPYLEHSGMTCHLAPFISPAFFQMLYTEGSLIPKAFQLLSFALKRLADMIKAGQYNLIFIHREAFLFGPPFGEWFITKGLKKPVVFDFDDALFVPYISPTYGKMLSLLKFPGKTSAILRMSRHIIAGNHYLKEYAVRYNPNVTVIPTVVDTEHFLPNPKAQRSNQVTIGWVGSHSSFPYLKSLFPLLRDLGKRFRFTLKVVGAGEEFQLPGVDLVNLPWSLNRELDDFQSLDIGVYPIVEDEWSKGKSGFKAIQYMAAGVPAVCSPVGVNSEIVKDGINGFLAATEDEWEEKLSMLIENALLRRHIGEAGRITVEEKYSLNVHAPRMLAILEEVSGQR